MGFIFTKGQVVGLIQTLWNFSLAVEIRKNDVQTGSLHWYVSRHIKQLLPVAHIFEEHNPSGGTKSPKFRCPCRSYVFEEAGDHGILQSWGFPESWGYPNSWLVFVRETPIEMDDLGVPPFMETPIYTVINGNPHIYHLSEMRKHDP